MLISMKTVGAIFLVIATAATFSPVLTLYSVAYTVTQWVNGLTKDTIVFLLVVNPFYPRMLHRHDAHHDADGQGARDRPGPLRRHHGVEPADWPDDAAL